MLLRRVNAHLKAQNWTAVWLDFFIVVVGVGFALMAENWVSSFQQRNELERAEAAIYDELFDLYLYANERRAIADCRKQRTRELAALLLAEDDGWQPAPADGAPSVAFRHALPEAFDLPARPWGMPVWELERARGSVDLMPAERQRDFDWLSASAQQIFLQQDRVLELANNLKPLAAVSDLSAALKTDYYQTLAQHDGANSLIEGIAIQVIERINNSAIEADRVMDHSERQDQLNQRLQMLVARFGECVDAAQWTSSSE